MTNRNFLLPLMAFLLLMSACSNEQIKEATWPEDLAGKKELLRKKKEERKILEADIDRLLVEINELDASKSEKKRRLVSVDTVNRQKFQRFVDIQGTVQSGEAVMASSEMGGRIIRLAVEEGDAVRKGQLIAKLDMESVNKQIAELEKALELAVDVYQRQQRLWDQNIGSELQVIKARNDKERLEKSLETAKFQLTKANVYAPLSGVVDHVFAKSGEMTGPGTPIVQILDVRKVKVVANLPEKYLGIMKKGEMVTVKFPALNEERKARVSLIGSTINPNNRTFEVEVELYNKSGLLKPNLLALMAINDFSMDDAVVVPLVVVQQEVSGRNYVYIKSEGEDGAIAQKRYVETGESYMGNIIITNGLQPGEELILEGARGLNNMEPVKVAEKDS